MKVAKEALHPENKGLEHVIAKKYGMMPWTVKRWAENYQQFGEAAFKKGFSLNKKTPREAELEKKVEYLEEEVKILKKAAAFLANVKHE